MADEMDEITSLLIDSLISFQNISTTALFQKFCRYSIWKRKVKSKMSVRARVISTNPNDIENVAGNPLQAKRGLQSSKGNVELNVNCRVDF